MKNKRNIFFLLLMVSILILPCNINAINKYTVLLQQPDLIRPPVISWVTVNDSNKNHIVWKKQLNDNIVYYNVYRNSNNSDNEWDLAGTVDYNSDTYLNDLNSYARIQSYKYRIAAVDKCGNEVFSNLIFRTICLKIKEIKDGSVTIEWNPYEGINVIEYRIYRGLKPENMVVIDSLKPTILNFTDNKLLDLNYYYKVEAIGTEIDTLTQQINTPSLMKAASNLIKSESNTVSSRFDSIEYPINNESLHIYPNPLVSESVIEFPYDASVNYQLFIYDFLGRIVYYQTVLSGEFLLKHENLKDGMYFLQIKGKIILQKKLLVGGSNI